LDQHDLVAALKQLAGELGRTPTREEFCRAVRGAHYALPKFGGFMPLLQAAGMESRRFDKKDRPLGNIVFETSIDKHLEAYQPKEPIIQGPYPSIASISDIHWPFPNNRVVSRFQEFCGDLKPEWVILNGDAWDMYSHAKFPRSHNVFTPREEQAKARAMNEEFWQKIKARCPAAKCVQMIGNHDVRPMKRILEAYPEAEDWIAEKLKSLFSFTDVKTIFDPREELEIGNILVFHGYRSKLGDHRDYTLMNTINGHTHQGGVSFRRIRGQTLWELNSGLAGDPEAKGLTYTPQRITNWTPGFGAVDCHGPRFICEG